MIGLRHKIQYLTIIANKWYFLITITFALISFWQPQNWSFWSVNTKYHTKGFIILILKVNLFFEIKSSLNIAIYQNKAYNALRSWETPIYEFLKWIFNNIETPWNIIEIFIKQIWCIKYKENKTTKQGGLWWLDSCEFCVICGLWPLVIDYQRWVIDYKA